jgi:hypothetical protein
VIDGPARRIAHELRARGLGAPARLLVDAHRPLAPLLSDLGAALGPLLGAAIGRRADDLRAVLDDPRQLDSLIEQLDRRPTEKRSHADPG